MFIGLVALSGCSVLDAYLMTHYDPNEYQIITSIRADAQQHKKTCDNVEVSRHNSQRLAASTQMFVLYSEHIPRNIDVIESSKSLHAMAQSLADQYVKNDKVSSVFCRLKFENIEAGAENMQKTIGGRPR